MKILVIGSGGREHAICWKLRQSPKVDTIFCAPGNPGIGMVARCVDIKVTDVEALKQFAIENKIDLTVVGPELPLTLGVVDTFRAAGLRIFGATQAAAELEGSKSFAKKIMLEAGVPTAHYAVVHTKDDALSHIKKFGAPIVLKADGLASGKGVFVCKTDDEALAAVQSLFSQPGEHRVVIEEFLEGIEISYIIATDGEHIIPFAPSHDYKRIFDNDAGPNTGGMGSVCPTPRFSHADEEAALYGVMVPTIAYMKKRGTPFSGFLYAGLMKAPDGTFKVLEFNTRLGDPETQSIMMRLKSDLAELLYFLSDNPEGNAQELQDLPPLAWDERFSVCLVVASEGYPDNPTIGDEIKGLHLAETQPHAVVFHAGTKSADGKIVTAGGRVLGVTALGPTLAEARTNAYNAANMIQFRGSHVRRDIGLQ